MVARNTKMVENEAVNNPAGRCTLFREAVPDHQGGGASLLGGEHNHGRVHFWVFTRVGRFAKR